MNEEWLMPAKRELTMRQIRQMLRLARDGVSAREIGRTLGAARSTIQDNLRRAARAGLSWPLPAGLTDAVLEQRLFGHAGSKPGLRRRPEILRHIRALRHARQPQKARLVNKGG